jgi:uncharacterized protein (TIGR02598 family)
MIRNHHRPHPGYLRAGFSLVEVTLALGIASFTLLTFCGLLSVGVNSNRASSEQTAATHILTSVVSDIRNAPEDLTQSIRYQISIPAASGNASASAVAAAPVYLDENGETLASATSSRYLLSVWTTPSSSTNPSTLVRVMITWPGQAALDKASGSVESLIILDRN